MRARRASTDEPASEVDKTITGTVKALAASMDMPGPAVAAAIGMNQSTYYRRLASGFTAADVAALADFFGVEVSDLYTGLGGKLAPVPRASTRAFMHKRASAWGLAA